MKSAQQPAAPLPIVPRILRRDLAATYLSVSTTMLDNEVKAGRLPQPFVVLGSVKGWDRHDLDRWIEDRKAQQGAPAEAWDDI
jgi:predicted DNA-binding transcriptional regulator AlpA